MLTLALLLPILLTFQNNSNASSSAAVKNRLINQKWQLNKHVFANHDHTGTDSSTVAGGINDYIEFRADGTALVAYKGNTDILEYQITNDSLLHFGTNSYTITELKEHTLRLYQNEEEPNGDYNREWLELSH